MNANKKQSPVEILAQLTRGYATDKQCEAAVKHEADLRAALVESYEAMLQMRALLSREGVSLKGDKLNRVIERTAGRLF